MRRELDDGLCYNPHMKTISILNINFAALTVLEALDILEGFLGEGRNHVIVTPNPEGVMLSRRNPGFRDALQQADLALADGTGVVIASHILGKRLPERVRGVDTAYALFERLSQRKGGFTAYFLGAARGVAEKAKANMEERFSGLKVVGFHHGFFSGEEEAAIIGEINRLGPDILFVCTGMPRSEIWAVKNRDINARVTLCLGGTLDVMAGEAKLAPGFMRKMGLEWLYRLIRQPSRIVRQLDLVRFALAVFWEKFT